MTTTSLIYVGIDVISIIVLVYAIYMPKHQKKEMILPYIGLNLAIMGITFTMVSSSVSVGMGLGLLGILSIIRLRSTELTQTDIAYYFMALALGLISGLQPTPLYFGVLLPVAILTAVLLIEKISNRITFNTQQVVLDSVISDKEKLISELEFIVEGDVKKYEVVSTNMVNQTMTIRVTYIPFEKNSKEVRINGGFSIPSRDYA